MQCNEQLRASVGVSLGKKYVCINMQKERASRTYVQMQSESYYLIKRYKYHISL